MKHNTHKCLRLVVFRVLVISAGGVGRGVHAPVVLLGPLLPEHAGRYNGGRVIDQRQPHRSSGFERVQPCPGGQSLLHDSGESMGVLRPGVLVGVVRELTRVPCRDIHLVVFPSQAQHILANALPRLQLVAAQAPLSLQVRVRIVNGITSLKPPGGIVACVSVRKRMSAPDSW